MKLLTLTTLYPNDAAPAHGVFVENRLDAYRAYSGADIRVIAPVPWFPSRRPVFGRYARFAAASHSEERCGVAIRHPRYFLPPKIGMSYAPEALARIFEREARALIADGWDFDVIDAHYLYPDGVAAVRVAQKLGKPVVVTARGSDVTLFPKFPRQRAMILDALFKADRIVAVAEALKRDLVALGAPAEKITVLRNGVDLDRFRPLDRAAIRKRMDLDGRVIASVGGLIERKGHDLVIRAVAAMPDATLLIAGEGPEARRLKTLAKELGAAPRVRFLGALAHDALAEIYNAADALALASSREGWPNVLLEAMACGAPVAASDAGGAAEVVAEPAAGRIVEARTPQAFEAALGDIIASGDRAATRRYAEARSWDDTSKSLAALFDDVASQSKRRAAITCHAAPKHRAGKPMLLFTVDTEEQFNWGGFSATDFTVNGPRGVERLQALCEEFGVRPLYFLTYPMLTDAENAGYFRTLAESGRADFGLHLHQWNTPPIGGYEGAYYSWQGNLPAEAHAAKLQSLGEAFERALGFRAIAHRAGRYGVTPDAYREIAGAGIRYDFSPSASFDFSAHGGPDFSALSNDPFTVTTDMGAVHVTPVCGALALRGGRLFLKQAGEPGLTSRHRVYSRTLTAPFRLSCEQARLSELVSLTRSLEKAGTPILTFGLHSTSLTAGANPYAPDDAAVEASLALIRRYLQFFTKDFGGAPASLDDIAAFFSGRG